MPRMPVPVKMPPTEGERNARLARAQTYTKDVNQDRRIVHERRINQPRTYIVQRRDLGHGTAQIAPYMEATLPYDIYASALMLRVRGSGQGEGVVLLPKKDSRGVVSPEKSYLQGHTDMADDFTIPKGQSIRFLLTQTRVLTLSVTSCQRTPSTSTLASRTRP